MQKPPAFDAVQIRPTVRSRGVPERDFHDFPLPVRALARGDAVNGSRVAVRRGMTRRRKQFEQVDPRV